MLKMLFLSAPTQEQYSWTFLKILIFGLRRTFFPKPSQTCPKRSPDPSQTLPKTSEKSRKSDPELTSGRRESNPPPPDSKSLDHSTRLFSPQNIASVKIFYVSKNTDCMYQKYRVCASAPAGAFSELKIATLCSLSTENNSFCIFQTESGDF